MKTKQEIYDHVCKHLLTQNARSMDEKEGLCRYHGPDGKACAVGCLIPAEVPTDSIEGIDAWTLCDGREDFVRAYMDIDPADDAVVALLEDLQDIHDAAAVEKWERRLRELGLAHHLTPYTPQSCST